MRFRLFCLAAMAVLALPASCMADALVARSGHRAVPASSIRRSANLAPRSPALAVVLRQAAPGLDPQVLDLALSAVRCAQSHGAGDDAERLAVIDYSISSLRPRLWVFDLSNRRLLYREVVAHGQGSGGDVPTKFSNADSSHASSLGLFLTGHTYIGHNGYSLRLDGLDKGFNDAAMARAIVMHGATYVNPGVDHGLGRLGRSWGCPALRKAVAKPIIDLMKNGQFVFAYYPDQAWLARSALLRCAGTRSPTTLVASRTEHRG